MKANNFRKGNLIQEHGNIVVIDSLNNYGVNLFAQIKASDGDQRPEAFILPSLEYGDFEPIPLTDEWLAKFGFTEDNRDPIHEVNRNMTYWTKFPLELGWNVHGHYVLLSMKTGFHPVKYVHQLQNLYADLAQKELELLEASTEKC